MLEWGWTPDSFSAVGTVGALVATAWLAIREALARVRTQAEQLVVWIARRTSPPPDERDIGLFLHVRNDSKGPILELRLAYENGSEGTYPVIAPGQELLLGLDRVVNGTLEYTDASGRRWKRRIGGGPPRRVRWRGSR